MCVLIRIAASRRFLIVLTTYYCQYIKENNSKFISGIIMSAAMGFSKGFKDEFEIAVVNEPSVFEPLKFYCITA